MFNSHGEIDNPLNNLSFMDRIRRNYDLTPSIIFILGLIVLFFFVFLIYPLLYVFKEAFWIENRLNLTFFKLMITDPNIRKLVVNSFYIGIMVTLMTSLVSLPLAYLPDTLPFSGQKLAAFCHFNTHDYATFCRCFGNAKVLRSIR